MATLAGEAAIRIVPTLRGFKKDADTQLRAMEFKPLEVRIDPGFKEADVKMAAWRQRQERNALNVPVHGDFRQFRQELTQVEHIFKRSAIQSAVRMNVKIVGLDALPALASAAGSAASGVEALSQSLLILPGLAGGVLSSVAALAVGLHGVSAAFKAYGEDSKNAVQNARASADANRTLQNSYRDYATAVKGAKREIQDLNDENRSNSLSVADAVLSVQEAADRVREGGQKSILELRRDQLNYLEAVDHLQEVNKKAQRTVADASEANAKGIPGNERVADALDKIAKAQEAVSASNITAAATALSKLSPEAAKTVEAIHAFDDQWKKLEITVGNNLFEGLSKSATDLGQKALPGLEIGLSRVASGLNSNVKSIAESLGSDKNGGLLQRVFGNTDDGLKKLSGAFDPLITGILRVTATSSDFLPRLGEAAEKVFTRFDEFTQRISTDGTLVGWIDNGLKAFTELSTSVGNIFSIIGSVGDAYNRATGQSDGMVGSLLRGTDYLKDLLNSAKGKNGLVHYFEQARDFASGIKDALNTMRPFFREVTDTARNWSVGLFSVVGAFAQVAGFIDTQIFPLKTLLQLYLSWKVVSPIIDGVTASWRNYAKAVVAANNLGVPGTSRAADSLAAFRGSAQTNQQRALNNLPMQGPARATNVPGVTAPTGLTVQPGKPTPPRFPGGAVTVSNNPLIADASKTPILAPSRGPAYVSAEQLRARYEQNIDNGGNSLGQKLRNEALFKQVQAAEAAEAKGGGAAALGAQPKPIDPKVTPSVESYRKSVATMNAEVNKAFGPLLAQQNGTAGAGAAAVTATPQTKAFGDAAKATAAESKNLGAQAQAAGKQVTAAGNAAPAATKNITSLGAEAGTAAPKLTNVEKAALNAIAPTKNIGEAAATTAPKVQALGTAAGTTGTSLGTAGGIGLVGKLGALASTLAPLAIATGVIFAVTTLITQLGQGQKFAAEQTLAHDDALKNLTTTLDGVTGRATQQTLTQVGQDFNSVPGLNGQAPQDVNKIFPKVGIKPTDAALAAADPSQTKLLADLTDPQDEAVRAQLENDPQYKRNKHFFDDAHIDSLTLAKAINGDPDSLKKYQDLLAKPPTTAPPGGHGGGQPVPVTLPELGNFVDALPNQDPFKAANAIRTAAEANRVKGTSIAAGSVAARGAHNLLPQGQDFFAGMNPEGTATINSEGRAVLVLNNPPALDSDPQYEYWRSLGFDVGPQDPDGHSRQITLSQDFTHNPANFDGFADGGMIRGIGGPRDDMNLIKVSPGEHITNAAATAFYGSKAMSDLNQMKIPKEALGQSFAGGGFPGFKLAPPPPPSPTPPPRNLGPGQSLNPDGTVHWNFPPGYTQNVPLPATPAPAPAPGAPVGHSNPSPTPPPAAPAVPAAGAGGAGSQAGRKGPQTPVITDRTLPALPDQSVLGPYVPDLTGTGALPDSKSTAASIAPNASIIPDANILGYESYVGQQYGLAVGAGADTAHGGTHSVDGKLHSFNRATDLGNTQQAADGSIARFVQAWEADPNKVAATRQLIYSDPSTGQKYGIINGRVLSGSELDSVYGKDFPDHTGHVHLGLEGVPSDAVTGTGGAGTGTGLDGLAQNIPEPSTGILGAFKKMLGLNGNGITGPGGMFQPPSDKDGADFLKKEILSVAGQAGTIGLEAVGSFFGLDLSYLDDAKTAANFYLKKGEKNGSDTGNSSATDIAMAEFKRYQENNGPQDLNDPKAVAAMRAQGINTDLVTTGSASASSADPGNGPLDQPGQKGGEAYRSMVRQIVAQVAPGLQIPKAAYGEWEDALVKQIDTESGGDPFSNNSNDPNGKGGTQTVKGLLNFLPSTFTGLGFKADEINNPGAQIAAAMLLTAKHGLEDDGGPKVIGEGHGFYADGGSPNTGKAWVSPGEFHTSAAAVAHYGPAVYDAINSMAMPRLAGGGWWNGAGTSGAPANPLQVFAPTAPAAAFNRGAAAATGQGTGTAAPGFGQQLVGGSQRALGVIGEGYNWFDTAGGLASKTQPSIRVDPATGKNYLQQPPQELGVGGYKSVAAEALDALGGAARKEAPAFNIRQHDLGVRPVGSRAMVEPNEFRYTANHPDTDRIMGELSLTPSEGADGLKSFYINMIKTNEANRGQGVAKGLLNRLMGDYPGALVDPGVMTDMGKGMADHLVGSNPAYKNHLVPGSGVGHANGGRIEGKGSGIGDKIPVRLSHGEHVMTAAASKAIGHDRLDAANAGHFAVGGFPFLPEGNVTANGPLPLPPKPDEKPKSTPQDIQPMTPPAPSSVGDPAARFKIPQAGSAPGTGATAPAPDPGVLPKVQDALTTIGGAGGVGGVGNPQPGATDNQGPNSRSALGQAPASTDHENPGLKAGISGAATQLGSLAAQAASAAAAAGTFGAGGGGGSLGPQIQAAFEIGGHAANNVANVVSSLLVGTATGGSTSNASGVPLLPSRPDQQSGVPPVAQNVAHQGDNHYHVTDLDGLKRQQETTAAQAAMPFIGKY